MQRRHFLCSLLALALAAGAPARAADSTPTRLVFHVNDDAPDHQDAVLRNLQNHLASVGADKLDIVVLLQGGGVTMLLLPEALARVQGLGVANADAVFRERIDALRQAGVRFEVSGLTLARHHIDPRRDLYKVHPRDVVANALAHLAELQAQGYSYIKP